MKAPEDRLFDLSDATVRGAVAGAVLALLCTTAARAQDSTGRAAPGRPAADGVRWQSSDGRWQAQLLGRLQFDYRTFQPSGAVPDVFSLRRIRFGTSVTYATDYTFVLEGEYATGNAGTTTQTASLVNGYLAFDRFRPAARLLAGQFKPAFGLENTGSDNLTDFTERSLQYGLLQKLSYDRGVAVTGAPTAMPGLSYSVAATNGTGINTEEPAGNPQSVAADGKMLTLRLTQNVAAWLRNRHSVYHLGFNYKRGDAANSPAAPYTAPALQSEGRGVTFFTPQPFNAAGGVTATNVGRRLTRGQVVDEARLAGRAGNTFKHSEDPYFHDMDGAVTLTPQEEAGRNMWLVWSGGNDRFWD